MVDREQIKNFMSRWNVMPSDDQLFSEFRNRVGQAVVEFTNDWSPFSAIQRIELERQFASISGTHVANSSPNLYLYIQSSTSFESLVFTLQRIFWAVDACRQVRSFAREQQAALIKLVENLNRALDVSPGANIRRIELASDGSVDLCPEGASLLDRELVDAPVAWLNEYPAVAREYKKALSLLALKQSSTVRQALDALRYSLENLVKIVLCNNAPLEKQKQALLAWMKARGVHAQIRNDYATILDHFALLQNATVKHNSAPTIGETYSFAEAEYILYVTGTLVRFLLELHRAA